MNGEITLVVAVLGGGVILVRHLLAQSASEEARLDDAWATAARRLGAQLDLASVSFFGNSRRRLRIRTGETSLLVSAIVVPEYGRGRRFLTRLDGQLMGFGDVDIHVESRGLLGKIARGLSVPEVGTDDAVFDAAFRIRGSPPALVREFFDADTRKLVADAGVGFAIRDGLVRVDCEGEARETRAIVDLARYGEALAERWHRLAEAPCRLAEELGLDPIANLVSIAHGTDTMVARGVRRGRAITMAIRSLPDRVSTVLSFEDPTGEAYETTSDGVRPDPHEFARRLDSSLERARGTGTYR